MEGCLGLESLWQCSRWFVLALVYFVSEWLWQLNVGSGGSVLLYWEQRYAKSEYQGQGIYKSDLHVFGKSY